MLSEQPPRREPLPGFLRVPLHLLDGLSPGWRWLVLAIAGSVLAATITLIVLFVPSLRADQRAGEAAAERRAATQRAALVARLSRQAQVRRGAGSAVTSTAPGAVPARRRLLASLEVAVLADARGRVRRGEMRGPVRSVSCFEFPKRLDAPPAERQTDRRVMRIECVAVANRVAPGSRTTGSLIGQPFRARVDFARGRFAWCRIVQRPGELSIQQALVRVPAGCGG